jgi:hypothetical protein
MGAARKIRVADAAARHEMPATALDDRRRVAAPEHCRLAVGCDREEHALEEHTLSEEVLLAADSWATALQVEADPWQRSADEDEVLDAALALLTAIQRWRAARRRATSS